MSLNFPVLEDVLSLDLGHVTRHQTLDQEHSTLIDTQTGKHGNGPTLEEKTIRDLKLKTHDRKVFVPKSIYRELAD